MATRINMAGNGNNSNKDPINELEAFVQRTSTVFATVALGVALSTSNLFGNTVAFADTTLTPPAIATATEKTSANYDGFADYAQDNKMEKSDVGCFMNKCGDQTKALFANPRGIKGVSCLGRCKGEQSCATRCFAEYGSKDLNNWLSCTIEDNECVKVPKNVDNSAENLGYSSAIRNFDPKTLTGTWYKVSLCL